MIYNLSSASLLHNTLWDVLILATKLDEQNVSSSILLPKWMNILYKHRNIFCFHLLTLYMEE